MSLVETAPYDEPGSWGRLSEGWPETAYSPAKLLLCTKANVVPYGSYVVNRPEYPLYIGATIRCATEEMRDRLERVHREMFGGCRHMIEEELRIGR